ncbi:MAG: hypothetical protein U0931_11320 [Vulcanimicrobiota bacterium]
MRFRNSLSWLLVANFALVGCGGGSSSNFVSGGNFGLSDSGSAAGQQTTRSKVVLPTSFALPLTSLSVSSVQGDSPVSVDGTYLVSVPGGQPLMVAVQSATGKIVLFGFKVGTSDLELGTRSTAIGLLFYATGAFRLPAGEQAAALNAIAQDPNLTAVVSALEAALAANPTALSDGDARIGQAIQAFIQAVRPRLAPPLASQISPRAEEVSVTPDAQTIRSGVSAEASPAGGVKVTNRYRRTGHLFAFQTGKVDSNGVSSDIRPYRRVTPDKIVLSAPNALNSLVGTAVNLFFGNYPWVPTDAEVPAGNLVGDGDDQADQFMVVADLPSIGTSLQRHSPPVWESDANFSAADKDALRADHDRLMIYSFFTDVFLSIVQSITGLSALNRAGEEDAMVELFETIVGADASLGQVAEQIRAGNSSSWLGALGQLLAACAQNAALLEQLAGSYISQQSLRAGATKLLGAIARTNEIVLAIDVGLGLADVELVLASYALSNPSETWNVNVRGPLGDKIKWQIPFHFSNIDDLGPGESGTNLGYYYDFTLTLKADRNPATNQLSNLTVDPAQGDLHLVRANGSVTKNNSSTSYIGVDPATHYPISTSFEAGKLFVNVALAGDTSQPFIDLTFSGGNSNDVIAITTNPDGVSPVRTIVTSVGFRHSGPNGTIAAPLRLPLDPRTLAVPLGTADSSYPDPTSRHIIWESVGARPQ